LNSFSSLKGRIGINITHSAYQVAFIDLVFSASKEAVCLMHKVNCQLKSHRKFNTNVVLMFHVL